MTEIVVRGPSTHSIEDPTTGERFDAWAWHAEAQVDGVVYGEVLISGPDLPEVEWPRMRTAVRRALLNKINEIRRKPMPVPGSSDRRWTQPNAIDQWTAHHPPATPAVARVHEQVRVSFRTLMHLMNDVLPEAPMKTDVLNGLREVMWAANATVAVHGNYDQLWVQLAEDGFTWGETQHPDAAAVDELATWLAREFPRETVQANEDGVGATELAERLLGAAKTNLATINNQLAADNRSISAYQQLLNQLGEFLATHYQITILRLEDPIKEAIRLLSVADSPAHRAAHDSEGLARQFHETYERLAPEYGYETRRESAVPWDQVPEQNRHLMIAVAREILTGPVLEMVAGTFSPGTPDWLRGITDEQLAAELLRRSRADRVTLYANTAAGRSLAVQDDNVDGTGVPMRQVYTLTGPAGWKPGMPPLFELDQSVDIPVRPGPDEERAAGLISNDEYEAIKARAERESRLGKLADPEY